MAVGKGRAGEGAPSHAAPQVPAGGWLNRLCSPWVRRTRPAPRRSAAPSRHVPRSSPPARRLAPPRRLTVRRNWISSSPPSPPSAMAPEASALPQPPAPLLPSAAAQRARQLLRSLCSSSSSSSGSWLSLSSAELILDHIGSWANTPLHCRAPTPTKQPAHPSHLSPQPSARRPPASRRA